MQNSFDERTNLLHKYSYKFSYSFRTDLIHVLIMAFRLAFICIRSATSHVKLLLNSGSTTARFFFIFFWLETRL